MSEPGACQRQIDRGETQLVIQHEEKLEERERERERERGERKVHVLHIERFLRCIFALIEA
eukprot:750978-Hanusia_phi.AAC.1